MKQLFILLLFSSLFLSFGPCFRVSAQDCSCTFAVPLIPPFPRPINNKCGVLIPPNIKVKYIPSITTCNAATDACTCKLVCVTSNDYVWTAFGCINTNPSAFVSWVLENVMKVAGALAFLLMLLGTVKIITSGGNPEAIGEGKEIITSAVTGLLLVIFAAVILRFIGVDILKIPGFL